MGLFVFGNYGRRLSSSVIKRWRLPNSLNVIKTSPALYRTGDVIAVPEASDKRKIWGVMAPKRTTPPGQL
jgi:hypothetical protein